MDTHTHTPKEGPLTTVNQFISLIHILMPSSL